MLKSDDLEVQKKLLPKILSVRCEQPAKKRLKKIKTINTEATHWLQLISLSENGICELALIIQNPSLTRSCKMHCWMTPSLIYQSYLHIPIVLKGLLSWLLKLLIVCMVPRGGGVLTYLAERGCAALMGRFFTRNP